MVFPISYLAKEDLFIGGMWEMVTYINHEHSINMEAKIVGLPCAWYYTHLYFNLYGRREVNVIIHISKKLKLLP